MKRQNCGFHLKPKNITSHLFTYYKCNGNIVSVLTFEYLIIITNNHDNCTTCCKVKPGLSNVSSSLMSGRRKRQDSLEYRVFKWPGCIFDYLVLQKNLNVLLKL